MVVEIRDLTLSDYDAVVALWKDTPGVLFRPLSDSKPNIARFLERNPGLSAIALSDGQVVGTALASHDGRRGFLQHVVVAARLRKQGIAKELVERCVSRLRAENLAWVHLDVSVENAGALAYWTREGWRPRDELVRLSMAL